ncbi:MAG: glycosyltransferase [Oscillospiraceae bacterium]
MEKIIYEINTDNLKDIDISEDLIHARKIMADAAVSMSEFHSDVSICVQAFNRLDKTKACIESILRNTKGIDYDLFLIDSGSSDGTFEYFKSIEHEKVRILRLTKNITSSFPGNFINLSWVGKYLVSVANDILVTPNWLNNLIAVAESDPKIGIVNPVSSNVSNMQGYDMQFDDIEDMYNKAAEFNKSDAKKWHERLRIITLGTLYKKDCLYAMGFPVGDMGFFHDFSDDDIAFRARRTGYKVVLAKDTWIHHNHKVFQMENKNPEAFERSLRVGRKNFNDKYFGVDAWDDVNNFINEFIPAIKDSDAEIPKILGIDVKCGTPVLEIKNTIRKFEKFNAECYAFTQNAKYFIDLQTICGANNVFSNKIDCLTNNFEPESFDYIIIGDYINSYAEPYNVIKEAIKLLKPEGQLFVSLKNTYDIINIMYSLGFINNAVYSGYMNISVDEFYSRLLNSKKYHVNLIEAVPYGNDILSNDNINFMVEILNKVNPSAIKEQSSRLVTNKYAFEITKI